MATLPAVVTIQDLPAGTAITGTELIEAVQTSGGVAQSVQLSLSQVVTSTIGGLPTGGGTGQMLISQGTGFLSNWTAISSLVSASTGLARTGSTTIAIALASAAGLSVLGVGGVSSAVPAAIAGAADQVLVVNHAATGVVFGPVNLATSAAVTGVLPGANYSAVNLATTGAGGVQNFLPGTSIATASLGVAQINTTAIATTAQYLANTTSLLLQTDQVWAAAVASTLTFTTSTVSLDMSTFINANLTMGGNSTLGNPTNTKNGQSGLIQILQDATGNRTLAYQANWKFIGGQAPTLTTTASARDLLTYYVVTSTVIAATLMRNVS